MITGAHVVIYSTDPEADRAFFRDVLKFPHVDVGGGWLIFGLPPSEAAFHPGHENGRHEFYLMCDDLRALTQRLEAERIACSPVHEEPWGSLIEATLPGGGKLGIYQPKHERPPVA
jgi:catechol 2,3-dioxygenase-like lactoylglutathione lyase family enzyme